MRWTRALPIVALALLGCGGGDVAVVRPPPPPPASKPLATASATPSGSEAPTSPPTDAPPPWSVARRAGFGLGDDHGCRLADDGKVRCWGRNDKGQLGQGDKERRLEPVVVTALQDVARLSVTRYGNCVLSSAGEVRCWGVNFAATPEPIALPEPAADMIAAGLELCFRLRSGKLVCVERYNVKSEHAWHEVKLPGATVAVGDEHACSVDDGRVYCTGNNRHGQLGIGRDRARAANREPVLGLTDAVAVYAGADASCAVDGEGKAWCWGKLPNGEWSSPHPVAVPAVRSIAIGAGHLCAVARSGELWCWGENQSGQLGDGTDEQRDVPVRARGLDDVQAVAVARQFTCATRRDASLWCWGDNRYGRLGSREVRESMRPVRIEGLPAASALAVSDEAGCAVVRDGTMRCWGDNSQALFDDGSLEPHLKPVTSLHLRDMKSLSLTRKHACGVDTAGAAWCWGVPDERLGVGLHKPKRVRVTRAQLLIALRKAAKAQQDPQHPQKMRQAKITSREPRRLAAPSHVEQIDTGVERSCARDTSGGVWCWGRAPVGDGSHVARARPVRVAGLPSAVDLAVGSDYACVAEKSGTVACWGGNRRGQLGDGGGKERFVPFRVVGLDDAIGVTAGDDHACALRRDGQVTCWGANDFGQVGNGTAGDKPAMPAPVSQLGHAAMLAAGYDHSCALDRSGKVWCWGGNQRGQLGLGHGRDVSQPQPVAGLDDVTAIAAGFQATCALVRDGSVWCWGAFLPTLQGAWSPIPTRL